eukprot:m.243934 g.243934  ORF g.243934 m.243934 type:complete len:361 (+) comp28921_c0_seq1:35-1117(+)
MAADLEKARKAKKPVSTTEEDALILCKELFGVEGSRARVLNSYDDHNFLVETSNGSKFTLKIHNGADSVNIPFLQAQNHMIDVLSAADIVVPRSVSTIVQVENARRVDTYITTTPVRFADGTQGQCAVRLLTFIDFPLMCERPPTLPLFRSLGAFMAKTDHVLLAADHPALHRQHLWDLRNLPLLRLFLPCVTDPARAALATKVLDLFEATAASVLPGLRQSVIHSDANDHNILVSPDGNHVAGIIDFGDSLHTALVCELAITTAYAVLDQPDVLSVAQCVIESYTEVLPLFREEQSLLHTLTASRLCQSVIMSAYSFSCNPTNTYLLVTSAPGWQALQTLFDMPPDTITRFNGFARLCE